MLYSPLEFWLVQCSTQTQCAWARAQLRLKKKHPRTIVCFKISPSSYKVAMTSQWSFVWRYIAVCHPQNYRHLNVSMNNAARVLLYVVPVAVISIGLNIPKFFESKVPDCLFDFSTYSQTALLKLQQMALQRFFPTTFCHDAIKEMRQLVSLTIQTHYSWVAQDRDLWRMIYQLSFSTTIAYNIQIRIGKGHHP